ncbi:hypothetical protein FRD01_14565 [Microvenator marinus]|uniref:NACHT domain-containing protein n=1 Tax=Microvenator marinus TaxID=2600177 RepID=A0A5B8XSE4_9DELT|nr:hypothetical protein [Microvenator marinus]QED28435.1 hypothetical protein FRD01_14565 [Microvenator marinus]
MSDFTRGDIADFRVTRETEDKSKWDDLEFQITRQKITTFHRYQVKDQKTPLDQVEFTEMLREVHTSKQRRYEFFVSTLVKIPGFGSLVELQKICERLSKPNAEIGLIQKSFHREEKKFVEGIRAALDVEIEEVMAICQRLSIRSADERHLRDHAADLLRELGAEEPLTASALLRESLRGLDGASHHTLSEFFKILDLETPSIINVSKLRERTEEIATKLINQKWKAVRDGDPILLPLRTATLITRTEESARPIDLSVAALGCRRMVIVGPLGSGKSTTAAQLARTIQHDSPDEWVGLVHASELTHKRSAEPFDLLDILHFIYFNGGGSDLGKPPLAVVVDGFDELGPADQQKLRSRLDKSNITHVAIMSRPLDVRSYQASGWDCASLRPLAKEEMKQLRLAEFEAINKGMESQAGYLGETPSALEGLPATPLTARLMLESNRRNLSNTGFQTLGDLLYNLLHTRLGDWDSAAGQLEGSEFTAEFPQPDQRMNVFGVLALQGKISLPISKALKVLEAKLTPKVAASAVDEFIQRGLLVEETKGRVDFPLEAIREFSAGWAASQSDEALSNLAWREFAFACCALRRREELDGDVLVGMFAKNAAKIGLTETCYAVAETDDRGLAEQLWIAVNEGRMSRCIRRFPIREGEWSEAVARALYLGGETGFDWFWGAYLDPRYPLNDEDFWVVEGVLPRWIAQHEVLPNYASEKLMLLARTLLVTHQGSISLLPALATVVPEVFDPIERRWFQFHALASQSLRQFPQRALESCLTEDQELTLAVAAICPYAPDVLEWWLSRFKEPPPVELVCRLFGKNFDPDRRANLFSKIEKLVGCEGFQAVARLAAADNSPLASVELFRRGERDFDFLLPGLEHGIHDGGYVAEAAEIYALLVRSQPDGATWLSHRMGEKWWNGMSTHWEILLGLLKPSDDSLVNTLVKAMSGTTSFTLSRRPDLISRIQSLLQCGNAATIENDLRTFLSSPNQFERYAAAFLLTIPHFSEFARRIGLERLLDFRANPVIWNNELDEYLLTQKYSSAELLSLESIAVSGPDEPAALAAAILLVNEQKLSDELRQRVIRLSLSYKWPFSCRELVGKTISREEAHGAFIKLVQENGPLSDIAADKLLTEYDLSDDVQKRCIAVVFESVFRASTWEQVEALVSDSEFIQQSEALPFDSPSRLLASSVRSALSSNASTSRIGWRQLVWSAVKQDDLRMMNVSAAPLHLLQIGQEFPTVGDAIGEAATALLGELDWDQVGPESLHWLGVLSDEFGDLSLKVVEQLLKIKPINPKGQGALYARRGEDFVVIPHDRWEVPQTEQLSPPTSSSLRDIAKSETHNVPLRWGLILDWDLLRQEILTQDVEVLVSASPIGALLASALSFILDQQFDPATVSAIQAQGRCRFAFHNDNRDTSLFLTLSRAALRRTENSEAVVKEMLNRLRQKDRFGRPSLSLLTGLAELSPKDLPISVALEAIGEEPTRAATKLLLELLALDDATLAAHHDFINRTIKRLDVKYSHPFVDPFVLFALPALLRRELLHPSTAETAARVVFQGTVLTLNNPNLGHRTGVEIESLTERIHPQVCSCWRKLMVGDPKLSLVATLLQRSTIQN